MGTDDRGWSRLAAPLAPPRLPDDRWWVRGADVQAFECCLPARGDQVPVTRRALQGWLIEVAVEAEVAYDVVVVASELLTNGLMHAGGGEMTLRAWREQDCLGLEVTSLEPDPGWPGAQPGWRERWEAGRGRHIVDELAEDFAVRTRGDQRVVSCRILL